MSEPLHPFEVTQVEALVYRARIATPVQTSFGIMRDRPAVLVRVIDTDGVQGWGEIWCNFPTVGAEHRARLLIETVAPLMLGMRFDDPSACFERLTQQLHVLGLQSGEPGPIAHVLAGLDIALWDLVGQRARRPLWQLLGGTSGTVRLYASGLNPTEPEKLAAVRAADGYRAFKLKVGFGDERDLANLRTLRRTLGDDVTLMIDANQAWNIEQTARMSQQLAEQQPIWLEEPITVDHSVADWQRLAERSAIPLAAGENFRGDAQFNDFLQSGALRVLQPDIAKWGGFSRCVPLARRTLAQPLLFCPHWLGGGIGLAASMHLKAAVGGDGFVEVDSNPNPLRDLLGLPAFKLVDSAMQLPDRPGLGVQPDLEAAKQYLVQSLHAVAEPH